jgi:hypothetical protein
MPGSSPRAGVFGEFDRGVELFVSTKSMTSSFANNVNNRGRSSSAEFETSAADIQSPHWASSISPTQPQLPIRFTTDGPILAA